MAGITLQVKNISSLLLAAGASIAFSFASRRFDNPTKPWLASAAIGTLLIFCQLGLIFVESKEEEELSLLRKQRMDRSRQVIAECDMISRQIQKDIEAGNHDSVKEWQEVRRNMREQ